jgi:flagellar hook assembly protein FlgD
VSRAPVAAFVALVIATVGAFFVTQHLKVSTPLIQYRPAPVPNTINPVYGSVCKRRNGSGQVVLTNYRRMQISFYLQNRSDNVTVQIVDRNHAPVRTIGANVFMTASPPKRHRFTWNGRLADGSVAPAGVYYVKVSLLHQGRSLIISNSTAALPVTVETTRPQPRVTGVTPATITPGSGAAVTIHYTGTGTLRPRILIYRVTGAAHRQVKDYAATTRRGVSTWDGTLAGGRSAPPGTYLVAVRLTDRACTTGTSPVSAAAAPHAVVTVS